MDTTIEDYAKFAAGFIRGDGLSVEARRELTASQWPITTSSQFPTLQPELPTFQRREEFAAALGVVVFNGPQGPGCWRRFKTDHLCRLNIDQGLLLT